ncbi:MAG: hypothetical protein WBV52_13705 [Pseudolabrys sp.]
MPTIINHVQSPEAFDPEAISVMDDAYECALRIFPALASESVRQVIAARIIGLARTGERDPRKLCEQSLADLDGRLVSR